MPGIHVVIIAGLGLALSSARADLLEPNVATFDVDGLTLSMPIDVFRRLYVRQENVVEMLGAIARRQAMEREVAAIRKQMRWSIEA